MKLLLGILLLFSPFIGVFLFLIYQFGVKKASFVFLLSVGITLLIVFLTAIGHIIIEDSL